jgi:hypothetical protein
MAQVAATGPSPASRPPVAAAVLPHPPLLVAELAGAAAAELDPLRTACRQALTAVVEAADLTVVVGDGPVWGVPEPSAPGSFHPYGTDVEVTLPALVTLDLPGLPAPARLADLPLSLAVAAHLLAALDPPPARLFAATVPASLGPGAAAAVGRALTTAAQAAAPAGGGSAAAAGRTVPTPKAVPSQEPGPAASAGRMVPTPQAAPTQGPGPAAAARPGATARLGVAPDDPGPLPGGSPGGGGRRVGLVVMGDLSACRTDQAPGAFRPEAAGLDASVAEAFRTARPERLLDLDPAQAADLSVAGRVPLQVLAGAFADAPAAGERGPAVRDRPTEAAPPVLRGRVLYEDAPYGVGYLVALLVAA